MNIFKSGLMYFVCVFGAGVVLGSVRVGLLVSRLGVRWAELLEMPFMFAVVVLAARWIVRRFQLASGRTRLAAGVVALGLLMLAESALALWLQGLSPRQYVQSRDPISGAAFLLMLGVFAITPAFFKINMKRLPPPCSRVSSKRGSNPPDTTSN
jgi:putative Mn2+ efflux pump MntP